jgi:hypothetical protein
MMFCQIALEEIDKQQSQSQNDTNVVDPTVVCKLYFKRAKARRLTGDYALAREDLNQSVQHLSTIDDDDCTMPYQQAIQKEFRHLEAAEKEGRKNRQRQKRAMQNVLSTTNGDDKKKETTTNTTTPAIYDATTEPPRQYSTLRARRKTSEAAAVQQGKQPLPQPAKSVQDLSYWQYYRLVVARVAETLLMWLGDDDEGEESEKLRKREGEED